MGPLEWMLLCSWATPDFQQFRPNSILPTNIRKSRKSESGFRRGNRLNQPLCSWSGLWRETSKEDSCSLPESSPTLDPWNFARSAQIGLENLRASGATWVVGFTWNARNSRKPSNGTATSLVEPATTATIRLKLLPQNNSNQIFKVSQINISGLRGKLDNVVNYMLEKHIQVAAIQETHLTSKCNIKAPPGFQLIAMNRPEKRGKGGGVAFLVSDEIKYSVKTLKNNDDHAEVQAIVIPYKDQQLTLINTYIPPSSSCTPGYSATLSNHLSGTATIIVGDMNAHNSLWFSSLSADSRGDKFAEEIDNSTFVVINENTPTRKTASCSSSPAISIVSSDLAMSISWSCESRLGSDHLPIIISLACEVHKVAAGKKSYINFKKADWENITSPKGKPRTSDPISQQKQQNSPTRETSSNLPTLETSKFQFLTTRSTSLYRKTRKPTG